MQKKENIENILNASAEMETLWNLPEFLTTLGVEGITITDKFDYDFYYDLYMKLVNKKEYKDNEIYKNLIYLLNSNSKFMAALMTYNREDLEEFSSSIVNTLLIKGIEADIKYLDSNIAYLENLNLEDHMSNEKLSYKYIQKAFIDYLTKLEIIKDTDKYITNDDIFNVILQRGKSSDNMSDKEFEDLANTPVSPEKLKALDDPKVKVAWENPLKNDDRWARILDPGLVYNDEYIEYDADGEATTRITITVYDEEHDQVQQFWFYKENPETVHFKLNYTYTVYDKELTPKTVNIKPFTNKVYTGDGFFHSYKPLNVEEYLEKFYWIRIKTLMEVLWLDFLVIKILKMLKGKDASYEAIAKLMRFYSSIQQHLQRKILKLDEKH